MKCLSDRKGDLGHATSPDDGEDIERPEGTLHYRPSRCLKKLCHPDDAWSSIAFTLFLRNSSSTGLQGGARVVWSILDIVAGRRLSGETTEVCLGAQYGGTS